MNYHRPAKREEKNEECDYKADFRCDTMNMMEVFTKTKINRNIGVLPSVYIRELCMSPAERQIFLTFNDDCIKLFPNKPSNELIEAWDVKPKIIFFSKWQIGEEYETFFTIRNRYKMSRLVKLSINDSPVFKLEKLVNFNRLGSMVTFEYKVKFRPQQLVDYYDTIKLKSEKETFEIYVLALAPRPIIDFPDKIDFGEVLVNFNNFRQIRLENISPIPAEASLSTEGFFTLDKQKILLNPKEVTTLTVYLNYRQINEVRDKLLVTYEKGEKLYIELYAICYCGNIYFEGKPAINMGELYVGLKFTKSVTLVNKTDELLNYVWLNNRDILIDKLEWDGLSIGLKELLNKKILKTGGMKYYDMLADSTHGNIIDTIFLKELDSSYKHFFLDPNFEIEPMTGQINPRSKQTFIIAFKPECVEKFKTKAYLEINGLNDRLSLTLKGEGCGPDIVMNVNTIDFEQIFMCSEHTYVITVRNIGLVKGTIRYVQNTKLSFGETIKCEPLLQEVLPGDVKHFEISVASSIAGSFVEDLWFMILESKKKIKCTMKGQIINPRLTIDKKIINFGTVSLGFKHKSTFVITNESPLSVEYKIEVVGDGYMPAMLIDINYESVLPTHPQEFLIEPEVDEIQPSHSKTIEVTLISNIVREYTTLLKIYLWDVLVEECSLTLKYKSITPIITCKPNEILLRYAFIDYNYIREITLFNGENLPTFFSFLPQEEMNSVAGPGLIFNLDPNSGYLSPNSGKIVKIEIRVVSLVPVSEKVCLKIFGLSDPINICSIRAFGMGPVVNPSTFMLSWGSIPVLKSFEKSFSLINVSPIIAFFKMHVEKYPDIWKLSIAESSIEPESELKITVTVELKDSGPIEDRLISEIIGSREIYVSISAEGFGSSIITEPNLFPLYDIGKVFRKEKHDDIIKVTNAGTRHHTIVFTTMKVIKNLTKAKADQEQGKYFKLIPYKLDLEGGVTQEMHLLYSWDKTEALEDTYYCYAIIQRRGKRVPLGSCTIRASFTDTELSFDPTSLDFRIDVPQISTPILPLCKSLTIFSRWSCTLFLECFLNFPFSFKNINSNSSEKYRFFFELESGESQSFDIEFDPTYISDCYSRVCCDYLTVTFKDHKVKACVPLRGEVNFPNIEISSHEINFGCVVQHCEGLQYAKLKNNTPLLLEYEWLWSQQQIFEMKSPHYDSASMSSQVSADTESKTCFSAEIPEKHLKHETGTNNILGTKEAMVFPFKGLKKSLSDTNLLSLSSLCQSLLPNTPDNYNKNEAIDNISNEECSEDFFFSENFNFSDDSEKYWSKTLTCLLEDQIYRKPSVVYTNELIETQEIPPKKSISDNVIMAQLSSSATSTVFSKFKLPTKLTETSDHRVPSQELFSPQRKRHSLCKKIFIQIPAINDKYVNDNDEYHFKSLYDFGITEITKVLPLAFHKALISKAIDIIPAKGKLKPYETSLATFIFNPEIQMKLKGEALLKVIGGPEETITFKGCSYPVCYEVIPLNINFGFGPFCEIWCTSFFVWNKGLKDINVCINVPDYCSISSCTEVTSLLPEHFGQSPVVAIIPPCEVAFYRVALYPGKIGEIRKEFFVQINDLPPVTVNIRGYSMPHQVHVALPRLIEPYDLEDMYIIFGTLTSHWFSFSEKEKDLYCNPVDPENSILMENEGWELFNAKHDIVPKIDDINMAYERYICDLFAMKHYGIVLHSSSLFGDEVFSEVEVPHYSLDFGSVITNTKAQCLVVYSNYCPMETILKINFPQNIDKISYRFGLVLKPQYTTMCFPFERKQFAILLQPPHCSLPAEKLETNIDFSFDIAVSCGPVIPVSVKASITQPCLCAEEYFDFGKIKVGYKRIIKCAIRNKNKIDCEWFAFIRPIKARGNCQLNFDEHLSPFTVNPVYGYTKANSSFLLTIGFEPKEEELYEVVLQFIINMNPQSINIRLKGCGLKPRVVVKDVSFECCVPFSKPLRKKLKIQNPCLFPLKAYFLEIEQNHMKEQDLFSYLLQYYRTKILCIPSIYYKSKPRNKLIMMFKRLVKQSIKTFLKDVFEFLKVLITGSHDSWKLANLEASSGGSSFQTKSKKGGKPKSRKYVYSKDKSENQQDLSNFIKVIIEENLLVKRLEEVINDYIRYITILDLKPSNLIVSEKLTKEKPKLECGNILFIYGSTRQYSDIFSLRISRLLKMETINLDWEIITDLLNYQSDKNNAIKDSIEDYYSEHFEDNVESTDILENWREKVKLVADHFFMKFKNKVPSFLRIKKPEPIAILEPITLFNLRLEYFHEIIKRRLYSKAKEGIIFDTLESCFFFDPVTTLKTLLDVFKQFSNILVLCTCPTFEGHHDIEDQNLTKFFADHTPNISPRSNVTTSPKSGGEKKVKTGHNIKIGKTKKLSGANTKNRGTNLLPSDINRSTREIADYLSLHEFQKNVVKIHGFFESHHPTNEKKIASTGSMPKSKIENIEDEILKKKAKLIVNEDRRFPLWIICFSTEDFESEQYDKYLKLFFSWKDGCFIKEVSITQLETAHNYFIIKRNPKIIKQKSLNIFENEFKAFKLQKFDDEKKSIELDVRNNHERKNYNQEKTSELKDIIKTETPNSIEGLQGLFKAVEMHYLEEIDSTMNSLKTKFNSGFLIKPGSSKQCDVTFSPLGCSTYVENYHVGVNGCDFIKKISLFGSCDIPDISFDPCCVFSNMLNEDIDSVTDIEIPGYIVAMKSYHFGTILIGHSVDKRLFERKSSLKLKNCSKIDVKLSICILEEKIEEEEDDLDEGNFAESDIKLIEEFIKKKNFINGKQIFSDSSFSRSKMTKPLKNYPAVKNDEISTIIHVFEVESPEIFIEAGKENTLNIFAYPPSEGLYSCKYIFTIENNPKVHILKAYCYGNEPSVVFTPNELFFEDTIIYRQVSQPFNIKNTCKVPLTWKVINPDLLNSRVLLSRTCGYLKPHECEVVFVSYHPTDIQEIRDRIVIQVFNEKSQGKSLLEHVYQLYLRSYDVQLEIQFESSGANSLDLKDMVVFQKITEELSIRNKGLSEVSVNISLNKDMDYLLKKIEVSWDDNYAVMKPFNLLQTKLNITCLEEMRLEEIPFCKIEVIDNIYEEKVAVIPLYLSLRSHFSRFKLSPTHNLDFGSVAVAELKCLEITLSNCGTIDFKYKFLAERGSLNDEKLFLYNTPSKKETKNVFMKKNKKMFDVKPKKQTFSKEFISMAQKNLSNLVFMHKFLKLQHIKHDNFHQFKKRKYLFKNYHCKRREWIGNINWAKRKKIYGNSLCFSDLSSTKTLKNLWDLYCIDNLKGKGGENVFKEEMLYQIKKSVFQHHIQDGKEGNLKYFIPPFRIAPGVGKIKVGEKVSINIHCNPLQEGYFQETIHLYVTDSAPDLRSGFPIHLSVESTLPRVNFENYETIFREIEVVNYCEQHEYRQNEGKPYEIFCIEEKSVFFLNNVIGRTRTITAYLHSENHIEASVFISLASNENESDFSLDEKDGIIVYIKPYGFSSFRVHYSPSTLQECTESLNFCLEVPDHIENHRWFSSVKLVGKGSYPSIILKDIAPSEDNNPVIDFGTIIISFNKTQSFCVENIGNVISEIRLEIPYNQDIFMMHVTQKQFKYFQEECDNASRGSTKLVIPPHEKAEVEIEFKPKEFMAYSSRINIHVLDNPFEIYVISLMGSGYLDDVVIEGLKFMEGEPLAFGGDVTAEYCLEFGYCIVGRKYTRDFALINNSSSIIRYQFNDISCGIIFIPSIGHIYPGSRKDIVSILQKSYVMQLNERVECCYEEIVYKDDLTFGEWDNALMSVKWIKTDGDLLTVKNIENAPTLNMQKSSNEPGFTTKKQNGDNYILPINVSAIFDIPKFMLVTQSIDFPAVVVSQSSEAEVVFQNISDCFASFSIIICNEKTEEPTEVPEISDFSFGKLNYNLSELPNISGSTELLFQQLKTSVVDKESSINTWKELRKKHLELLFGKSVRFISKEQLIEEKNSLGKPAAYFSSKSMKKINLLKRPRELRTKSNHSFKKKNSLLQKSQSITSSLSKKEDKIDASKATILSSKKPIGALKMARILNDLQFSELVKIGHTYLMLPSDVPRLALKYPIQSDSQHFDVSISSGILKPKELFSCQVKFLPKCIQHYKAELRIINVETEEISIIELSGLGILPLCHIDIDEDNYLKESVPLIPHCPSVTRVIRVQSIFTEIHIKKNFMVYNISEIPYRFKWINLRSSCSSSKTIKCNTIVGEILPRQAYEMEFSYFPTKYGLYESLWLLTIKEYFLEQPILFVFNIRKPSVTFEPNSVVFEPTVKGFKRSALVKLSNKDDLHFKYIVNENSLYSSDTNEKYLSISPMVGIVKPKSHNKLLIELEQQCGSDLLFNIKVEIFYDIYNIKYEIPSLKVLSKGQCVLPKVFYEKAGSTKIEVLPTCQTAYNTIEMGKLLLRIPYSLKILISNAGDVPLYFEAFLSENSHESAISVNIKEKSGLINPLGSQDVFISLVANCKVKFKECLFIKICKGPDFRILLTGTAAEPAYQFNLSSIDFGVCIVQKENIKKYCKILEFSNLDTDCIVLENQADKTAGFIVNFSSLSIEPRAIHKIEIYFYPLESKHYSDKVDFLLNGIYKHQITLTGEGENFKVELYNCDRIIIDIGLVKAKELVSKEVSIISKAKVPVDFLLKPCQKGNEDLFQVSINPVNKEMHLLPGEVSTVKIYIFGKERIQNFISYVICEGYGKAETLFIVKGTIIDYKFELDQKSILFDSTSIGCPNIKKFSLVNSGDIGARFKIETRFTSDVFSIKPTEGYSPPCSKTVIEIIFLPNFITKYCNNMVICSIENYEPLTLTVTGIGTKLPSPTDVIRFTTSVRTKISESMELTNNTYEEQILCPVLSGEYFSTEDIIKIPPNSSVECKVYYHPLTMTTSQFHMGYFFCGLPNGEVIFNQLIGQSTAPIPNKIYWTCTAKKVFRGKIPVKNWSTASETFNVIISSVTLTRPAFCEITNYDTISIPPKKTRNCGIELMCFKECKMKFEATFKSLCSKEYLCYKVSVIVVPSEVNYIELTTPVRIPIKYNICIENPMKKNTSFKLKSSHLGLQPSHKILQVAGLNKKYQTLKYTPVIPGSEKIYVSISNYLLGKSIYKLNVKAQDAMDEKLTEVQTPLGTSKIFPITVKNPFRSMVAFLFKSDSKDLSVKLPTFIVGPCKKRLMDVSFEPSSLGYHFSKITLCTNGFGNFSYPVKGLSLPPVPMGPLIITKDKPFHFKFKNVLSRPAEFSLKVNNDKFVINFEKLSMSPKETESISIKFIDQPHNLMFENIPQTGKLVISCTDQSPPLEWYYYLKAQ